MWLFFGFFYLFGAFLAAGLYYAYRLTPFSALGENPGASLSLSDYVLLTCRFLRPLCLIFLMGFTLFSCAVSAVLTVEIGAVMGRFVMGYCLSPLNPFTHPASLVLLMGFGMVFVAISSHAALYRSTLRAVAPDLRLVARDKRAQALFYNYLCASAIVMALAAALYFLIYYFPTP